MNQFKDYPMEPTGFMLIDFSNRQNDIIVKYNKEENMNNIQYFIGVKMIGVIPMTKGKAYQQGYIKEIIKDQDRDKPGYIVQNEDGNFHWRYKEAFDAIHYPIEDPTKITRNDVQGFIVKGEPVKMGEKTTIVMDSTLTGFDTIATSACVDPKNFNLEIGAEIARKDITDKIWGHLGFVLQWAKNGLKAKRVQTVTRSATAFTKYDSAGRYIIDDRAICDGNYIIPEEYLGKVISTRRFEWVEQVNL